MTHSLAWLQIRGSPDPHDYAANDKTMKPTLLYQTGRIELGLLQLQQDELWLLLLLRIGTLLLEAELSRRLGVSRILRTSSSKAWLTATLAFALVSTKRQPCLLANAWPSSLETSCSFACSEQCLLLQKSMHRMRRRYQTRSMDLPDLPCCQ